VEYGIGRMLIAIFMFPLSMWPYTYIRCVKMKSIKDYREHVVLQEFITKCKSSENIVLVSTHGTNASINMYIVAVIMSLYVSVVDIYPMLIPIVIICWIFVCIRAFTNYNVILIVTNASVCIYNILLGTARRYEINKIVSASVYYARHWSEIELDSIRIQPRLEIGNAYRIATAINDVIAENNRRHYDGDE